jgi:cell fate regulator YaaT (PSP1 superfamily)
VHYFDPEGVPMKWGDLVVAQTARGLELGEVKLGPQEVEAERLALPLRRIVRKATEEDRQRGEQLKGKEEGDLSLAREKIAQQGLPMKLVGAERTFDGGRIVFHFTAEGRVDFRGLVKDLARAFRTRIELHQVGVRDEAKLRGGIGPCGRELCCASFLRGFDPVSIRMAKDQELSLNPLKISGVCGRLVCCLGYEHRCYREARAGLPRVGARVQTGMGWGRLEEVNVPRQRARIALEEGGVEEMSLEELRGLGVVEEREGGEPGEEEKPGPES